MNRKKAARMMRESGPAGLPELRLGRYRVKEGCGNWPGDGGCRTCEKALVEGGLRCACGLALQALPIVPKDGCPPTDIHAVSKSGGILRAQAGIVRDQ